MTEDEGPPTPPPRGERRQGERRREERERVRLFEQLVAAEQDERRRLALFLHDGAVQSLSGIALMLDAVGHAIEEGRPEDAQQILATAVDRQRQTIQSLRDLSFNLEPIVLRDQGFVAAVRAQGVIAETGVFGADMAVSLVNDGPATFLIDSRKE